MDNIIIDRLVAAHREYKSSYPENTLLAFEKALKLGVAMVEFDLRLSKDKVVIVLHDETLDRTTNGSGKARDHIWDELCSLDAGGWLSKNFRGLKIPCLEELCVLLEPYSDILLNVEIKPAPDAGLLCVGYTNHGKNRQDLRKADV